MAPEVRSTGLYFEGAPTQTVEPLEGLHKLGGDRILLWSAAAKPTRRASIEARAAAGLIQVELCSLAL